MKISNRYAKTSIMYTKLMVFSKSADEVAAYYEKYYWNADHSGPRLIIFFLPLQEASTNTLRPGARKVVDLNGDGAITKMIFTMRGIWPLV